MKRVREMELLEAVSDLEDATNRMIVLEFLKKPYADTDKDMLSPLRGPCLKALCHAMNIDEEVEPLLKWETLQQESDQWNAKTMDVHGTSTHVIHNILIHMPIRCVCVYLFNSLIELMCVIRADERCGRIDQEM